ncbi:MAG: hypothetical protein JRJ11_11045 [Deltaproteobacteria bacterium]|nr:hypothetical protein [Deltaproteobacteria bacterium]MBW1910061.1 hypothetical protein [Deltaproteobacteria bacterium]MBW2035457.1 hypothetical protein [Deltaproteobacteria bacterium]MBW2115746.1 hypothetical protein [Deltaproteobacteria bacterium]MBW2168921.1 hypothetical protein [Deltaproteobacteria bacterium]
MKELKLNRNIEREKLQDEGSPNYWDTHDSTKVFETAERVKFEIARPDVNCHHCGSSRLRKRMIDLPVLEDTISFKKAKIVYCADCKISEIPEESLKEFEGRLERLGAKVDSHTFSAVVREGLAAYEKKYAEKVNQRKVMSIYFPKKEGAPAKAQISLLVSDQLYPILRSLTSEDVRSLLGLQYYEDLEKEAKKHDRSISQYLKHEIGKRSLIDNSRTNKSLSKDTEFGVKREEASAMHPSKAKILILRPGKIGAGHFVEEPFRTYKLAAHSVEAEEGIYLISEGEKFVGQLSHDFATDNLVFKVITDDVGLKTFDLKLVLKDGSEQFRQDAKVENGQILLMADTERYEQDVAELVLTLK